MTTGIRPLEGDQETWSEKIRGLNDVEGRSRCRDATAVLNATARSAHRREARDPPKQRAAAALATPVICKCNAIHPNPVEHVMLRSRGGHEYLD